MPKGHWGHGPNRSQKFREEHRLFPQLEQHRDITRGETRFAAEVMLAALDSEPVPQSAMDRAISIVGQLAGS